MCFSSFFIFSDCDLCFRSIIKIGCPLHPNSGEIILRTSCITKVILWGLFKAQFHVPRTTSVDFTSVFWHLDFLKGKVLSWLPFYHAFVLLGMLFELLVTWIRNISKIVDFLEIVMVICNVSGRLAEFFSKDCWPFLECNPTFNFYSPVNPSILHQISSIQFCYLV